MSISAMKQALEALEEVQRYDKTSEWFDKKVSALRQAIEQAEKQEPAANSLDWWALFDENQRLRAELKFNTAPPNREWVGLTAKDLAEIPPSCYEGAIWAEAKLREKNHENIEKVVLR